MSNICISIVTYNSEPVFTALDYLLANFKNNKKIRIRVFDNNSNDSFKKRLMNYKNIELTLHDENLGFGAAHNLNLKDINEEYCLVFNPDVLADEKTIDELLNYMNQHNDVAMITPKITNSDGSQQYLIRDKLTLFDFFLRRQPLSVLREKVFKKRMEQFENRLLSNDNPTPIKISSGCFMFVRTSAFKEVNGFDDRFFMYFEDYDLCNRLLKVGNIVYYPSVSVTHFYERGSHKNSKLFKIFIQSMVSYFNKWGWKFF